MRIAIVGTRGIPNEYGGFEQFAEDFSVRMVARGHDMTVYISHNHSYQQDTFKGVRLIHCYDPEYRIGTAGQFIYDYNCIRDSRKRDFDIILQLGYTSSTIWSWLFPKKAILVTNMDGLEWRRSKYKKPVQQFLRHAERWAVKYSDYLVADSKGIQQYIRSKYGAPAVFVPYGADCYTPEDCGGILADYQLNPGGYDLMIARFEAENNIELVLNAYRRLPGRTLVLIGKYDATAFGKKMHHEFSPLPNIRFLGGIFEKERLNAVRYHSAIYYHGHSVGGTNPSLLEAMACGALICANENEFNRAVLHDNAFYFNGIDDILGFAGQYGGKAGHRRWTDNNLAAIRSEYSWDGVTLSLENYFKEWLRP
jgi:glycosyltransferase involved in cell wall biosynthesis